VAAIYRSVAIDDPGNDGLWDAGLCSMPKVEPDFGAQGSTIQADATLALDCLEARFAARLARLLDEAAARRSPTEAAAAS
jgi:hypothetical protein